MVELIMRRHSLLLAVAIAVATSSSAIGAERATPRLLLQALENVDLNLDPTQAAVIFSLKKGDVDPAWDIFASDVQDGDLAGVVSWQLQLFNSNEMKVGYVQGRGAPPRAINWFGASEDGSLLPNGFYKARLIWIDETRKVRKTDAITTGLITLDEMRDFLGPNVTLSYVDEGLIIRIVEGMLFPSGRTDIEPQSLPTLAKIAQFLKSHPHNRLVVDGFTDSVGAADVNGVISSKRAKAVYTYLLQAGIEPDRAIYRGRGAQAPIASNETEVGRAKNRRVEIRVLKLGI
jgi:outer membrane protein OmpA-like peptidoglycan-associated protein